MLPVLGWLLAGCAAAKDHGPLADRAPYLVDASSYSAVVCKRSGGEDSCEPAADAALRLPGPGEALTFAAFGDSGAGTNAQKRVAEALEKADPRLVVLLGDVVYPTGKNEGYDDRFFAYYGKLAARRPFFPAVGNHDYANAGDYARGLKRFETGYARVFRRPPYYSFDAGPVHFAALDTNEAFGIGAAAPIVEGSKQLAWLDADLSASKAKWKILFMHVPLYASHGHGDSRKLRKALLPLIKKHGVDAVLAGHDHYYERWKNTDGGFVHMIIGTGGAPLYRPDPETPGPAKSLAAHGFVLGRADEKNLVLTFMDAEGQALDSVDLKK